ncbi:Uncharacterized protein HZ326_15868 [Fusarium oxysporum f. sp. albedinis]|nr:Uncharacterized protein HZ326_15868 [Fusarium oxysporum f. sp. albedinis]
MIAPDDEPRLARAAPSRAEKTAKLSFSSSPIFTRYGTLPRFAESSIAKPLLSLEETNGTTKSIDDHLVNTEEDLAELNVTDQVSCLIKAEGDLSQLMIWRDIVGFTCSETICLDSKVTGRQIKRHYVPMSASSFCILNLRFCRY